MNSVISENGVLYIVCLVFVLVVIGLAIYHFGYVVPKEKRKAKPPFKLNTNTWNLTDEDFNKN